jgi:hypothetical protein
MSPCGPRRIARAGERSSPTYYDIAGSVERLNTAVPAEQPKVPRLRMSFALAKLMLRSG